MAKVTGQIILQSDKNLTPTEILELEQYLNTTVTNLVYANKQVGMRVHLQAYEGATLNEIVRTFENG